MKLIYIANARIPTEKAHGIQIMKMCEAFAMDNAVELVLPARFNRIKDDPFDYYGIKKNFRIKKLPCFDLIRFHRYLGCWGLWIETLTFGFSLFFYLIFKKAGVFYTRDKLILPLVIIKKNLVFEDHAFPRKYFLYSCFIKKIKGIITITQKLKDLFVERGISPDKILVAPDGVDFEKFQILNSKSQTRGKLDLPQDKKIVLYTGHLYKWKGAQILADALRYLPVDVEVYFVGGTEEDIKKFKVQNSKLKVNVVGRRPYMEIPYWLKAADVLVLPNSGKEEISKYWTSPMKMFEYMAAQKPIVAADLPSIREILNETNAVLVESDNPEALARGIQEALQNPELSDRISAKAFRDVKQYSWQNRVIKILNFINP